MSDNNKSIYASVPFKFIVDGNSYSIHADLVSCHSKPLDRMMKGDMKEAQDGALVVKDFNEGTIARFIEWAYKGFYTAGDFKIEASSPLSSSSSSKEECAATESRNQPLEPDVPEADATVADAPAIEEEYPSGPPVFWASAFKPKTQKDLYGKTSKKIKLSKEAKSRQALGASFVEREYRVRQQAINIPIARANQGENEDYTEVFLSHAHIYVFAEKYDIQPLKTLALEELHYTLTMYTLYRRRTGDFVALLRYVYANTSESGDDLRKMLSGYLGYEMKAMTKDDEFCELIIGNGGPLLRDFMKMVAKRVD